MFKVFIGYDPREKEAFEVARYSLVRRASKPVDVVPLKLGECQKKGLFLRPLSTKNNIIYDTISNRPCSTEFSLSRFLVPFLVDSDTQWALFMDCDMLIQDDICSLEQYLDDSYAVMCTKHVHLTDTEVKMDGMVQVPYSRKNWSSFMFFNCWHPSNKALTLDYFNTTHRDNLHQFKWLKDSEIGSIPLEWNHLVGYKPPISADGETYLEYCYDKPSNIHYTHGMPFMFGYEGCEYSNEWRDEFEKFNQAVMEIRHEANS